MKVDFHYICPPRVVVGEPFEVSISVRPPGGGTVWEDWLYPESDEYQLHFMMSQGYDMESKPLDDGTITLRKQDGSFGPVKWELRATRASERKTIAIIVVNQAGLPVHRISCLIHVGEVPSSGGTLGCVFLP